MEEFEVIFEEVEEMWDYLSIGEGKRLLIERPILKAKKRPVIPQYYSVTYRFEPRTEAEEQALEAAIFDPRFEDTIFVFGDNFEQFRSNIRGHRGAVLRPFNKFGDFKNRPRSFGIVTGPTPDSYFDDDAEEDDVRNMRQDLLIQLCEIVVMMKYKSIVIVESQGSDWITDDIFVFTKYEVC